MDHHEKSKKLLKILKPREKHWVGDGFHVSTLFSVHSDDYQYLTPFLLFDHAAPKEFAPTEKKQGVGEHPHRGFETVTFAIQGEVDHRDSAGGGGTITTGGVQWMTAGAGVVHEEFHSRNFAKTGGVFEMVQLWVNLPAEHKMMNPRYQSMNKEDFPRFNIEGATAEIKLVAGEIGNHKGPAKTVTPITMYEVFVSEDGPLSLKFKNLTNTLVIQLKGASKIEDQTVNQGEVAIFGRPGEIVSIDALKGSHLLVLNGEPIDEPISTYGPFVMNTRAEIVQAVDDFNAGKMGRLVNEATD